MTAATAGHESGAPHVAVVGAGIAGLACARALAGKGLRVTVFERGGAVGGRLASLHTDAGVFDIGAQYLTVQNEAFADEVRSWIDADIARSWDANLADLSNGQGVLVAPTTTRYVGVPSMQSIAAFLARGLDVVLEAECARIARGADGYWSLHDAQDRPLGAGRYVALVLAIPSIDALPLVHAHPVFAPLLESVRWDACWSAMLALSRPSGIEFDGAFINDDPILAWAARDSSKPTRECGEGVAERWMLHARPSWSNNFSALSHDEAARWMQRAFAARLARPLAQKTCSALRIRAAAPVAPLTQAYLWDTHLRLGLAGDWCGGARVESAYLSGRALAQAVVS